MALVRLRLLAGSTCRALTARHVTKTRWQGIERAKVTRRARCAAIATRVFRTLVPALVVLIGITPDASAQRKERFADAVLAFVSAVSVPNGESRRAIDSALDRMSAELAQWDRTVDAIERDIRSRVAAATPADAARSLTTLAAIQFERGRVADAEVTVREALERDPLLHSAWILRGLLAEAGGDRPAAAEAFAAALRVAPSDPTAAYHLVRTASPERTPEAVQAAVAVLLDAHRSLLDAGDGQTRLVFFNSTLLDDARAPGPVFLPAAYDPFVEAIRRRQYDEALATARALVARDPLYDERKPSEVERRRSLTLIDRVEIAQAIAALRDAIAADPSNERAHLSLALLLNDLGDEEDALDALAEARQAVGPSGAIAWMEARILQELQRDLELAYVMEAVVLQPPIMGAGGVLTSAGGIRNANWHQETAALFVRNVALNPNSAAAHVLLGEFHRTWGHEALAIAEFVAAALLQPAAIKAHRNLGLMHLEAGRYPEAIRALRYVTTRQPDDEGAHAALANVLRLTGDVPGSEKALATYKALFLRSFEPRKRGVRLVTLRHEALVQLELGNPQDAIGIMQKVIDIAPSAVPYLVEFAEMLEEVGDVRRALTHYERARDLGAEAVIHLRLARLYKELGATAASRQAIRIYTASIAGRPRCEGDSCP